MLATALLCLVVGISDGDTLTARCGQPGEYEQVKIRLAGIDAPEKAQPFGQRSKDTLSDLCYMVNAKITPHAKDRYKRTVADVECRGKDAGQHLVYSGMAWVYEKYDKGYDHLYPLQDAAIKARRGLWQPGDAVAPWAWRKGTR